MVPWFLFALLGAGKMIRSFLKEKVFSVQYLVPASAAFIVFGFSLVLFRQTVYVLPAVPFLSILAAEFFQPWQATFNKWSLRFLLALSIFVILAAAILPVKFSTKSDPAFVDMIPVVKSFTVSGDTVLYSGNDGYTVEQMAGWYFDRPVAACTTSSEFFGKWANGSYKLGLLEKTDPDTMALALTYNAKSGRYFIYWRQPAENNTLLLETGATPAFR